MSRYLAYECVKPGCHRRRHMDDPHCIHHLKMPGQSWFIAWFAFCAILSVTVTLVILWAIIQVVQGVTS